MDLCQLLAIVRYLGRKHGLAGKTEGQQAAVEEVTILFCSSAVFMSHISFLRAADNQAHLVGWVARISTIMRTRTEMCPQLMALGRVCTGHPARK